MKTSYKHLLAFTITTISLSSCDKCNSGSEIKGNDNVPAAKNVAVNPPSFSSDSAYAYTQAQVDFGPRVVNTKTHDACGKWLIAKMKKLVDTVYVQQFESTGPNGVKLNCTNIIASINPKATTRVLLTSHWDSRPWADQDSIDKDKPFASASDGASGVATLMEIARDIQSKSLNIGVDLFFNDAEDYGKAPDEDTYCLGTQYWGKHTHVAGYRADFGILLDMAAAHNAIFTREATSSFSAGWVLDKVWENAAKLGYSAMFSNQNTGAITDDHVYINKLTNIPTIDIIQYDPSSRSGLFADYWHTHHDDMSVIDKNTLEAVGRTLLYTLYQYDAQQKPN